MRILIFEPLADGHRFQYVRMCVEAVAALAGSLILVTSRAAPGTGEFATHIQPALDRIEVDASLESAPASALRSAIHRAGLLRDAMRRHRAEHVYVPYADGLAQVAAAQRLLGRSWSERRAEVEGILMRGRFAYPHDRARDAVFARLWLATTARSPFNILHHLDPIPYEAIMRRGGGLAQRSRLIPEPVEEMQIVERAVARRRLGIPVDGRLVTCPGWLDTRKGVHLLLRAFADAPLAASDRLLLMGRVDTSIEQAVREAQAALGQRLIIFDGCRSDEELHMGMSAADVVCAPYPRHIGSSGIVVRAAALQRMLLASDYGWVGMVTRRFALGQTCDCRRQDALQRSLAPALDAGAEYQPSPAAARFSRFHTQSNFEKHLARRLRERLGLAPAADLHAWEEVVDSCSAPTSPALTAAAPGPDAET